MNCNTVNAAGPQWPTEANGQGLFVVSTPFEKQSNASHHFDRAEHHHDQTQPSINVGRASVLLAVGLTCVEFTGPSRPFSDAVTTNCENAPDFCEKFFSSVRLAKNLFLKKSTTYNTRAARFCELAFLKAN